MRRVARARKAEASMTRYLHKHVSLKLSMNVMIWIKSGLLNFGTLEHVLSMSEWYQ